MELNDDEIKSFTVDFIDDNNMPIFIMLLSLKSTVNYKRIIELLYSKKINLADLNNLNTIDDDTIKLFLNNYDTRYSMLTNYSLDLDPEVSVDIPSYIMSDIYPNDTVIMETIYNFNYVGIKGLLENYNYHNRFLNMKHISINTYNVIINSKSTYFKNINEFIHSFNELVLLPTLEELNYNDGFSPILPDRSDSLDLNFDCSKKFYRNIFSFITGYLEDINIIYKIFVKVNNEYSLNDIYSVAIDQIVQYDKNITHVITELVDGEIYRLASLNRYLNLDDLIKLQHDITSFEFTDNINIDMTILKFKFFLLNLGILHDIEFDELVINDNFYTDLKLLEDKIIVLKNILLTLQKYFTQNMHHLLN
jgi:hypothetical protein